MNREKWGTYQGKDLCQRVQMKRLKHTWAESDHIVVPFVSDTLSKTGESAVTMCLCAWCQAVHETELDNGNSALVEASKRALRRWAARLTLAGWRATAARATGPGVRVANSWGSRRNGSATFPETGVFVPPSPFYNKFINLLPPRTILLTLWGICARRSCAPTMGYHEPQNG